MILGVVFPRRAEEKIIALGLSVRSMADLAREISSWIMVLLASQMAAILNIVFQRRVGGERSAILRSGHQSMLR